MEEAGEAEKPQQSEKRPTARASLLAEADNVVREAGGAAAGAIELAVLEEWEAKELSDPTDPYRIFGLKSNATQEEIDFEYHSRMEMYEREGGAKEGSSRLLWLRASHAHQVLAAGESRGAYDEERCRRIRDGTWAKLRYANGLYEGSVDLSGEVPVRAGRGVMLVATGEKYDGEFAGDERHGVGVCFWQSGDLYVGQWKLGVMCGRGCYYYGTGVRYTGEFQEGRRHGAGRQVWPDGSTYTGSYVWGQRSGYGELQLKRERGKMSPGHYDGQWRDGSMEGYGKFNGLDHSYEGQFQSNRFHGQGTLGLPGGDTFKGTFVHGSREGPGEYEWHDNDKYVGQFKCNRPEGNGTFTSTVRGLELSGQWRSGLPQGHCVVTQEDFNTGGILAYDGQFERGRREGQGEMVWPSGAHYTGAFRLNRPHGPGLIEWTDGSSWDGGFVRGLRDGAGVFRRPGQEDGLAEERVEVWGQGNRRLSSVAMPAASRV